MSQYRILVCGGVNQSDKELVYRILNLYVNDIFETDGENDFVIMYCKDKGKISLAESFVKTKNNDATSLGYKIRSEAYEPDYVKYGDTAEYFRNISVVRNSNPDIVFVFPGVSYANIIIDAAKKSNIRVRFYQ